jgi:hypothetical protein
MMDERTVVQTHVMWGLLSLLIAFNFAIIAGRLLIRAGRDHSLVAARILYGLMFTAVSIYFTIRGGYWLVSHDPRPATGLAALAIMWAATSAAVVYLVLWRRDNPIEQEMSEGHDDPTVYAAGRRAGIAEEQHDQREREGRRDA